MKSALFILIAVLLAVNNIFINFRIGNLSYDRLLEFGLFFLFFKSYITELRENSFFRKYNLYIILFAIVQFLMNIKLVMFNGAETKIIYVSFVKCFSYIVFSYLFLLIVKENTKYLNIIIAIHLGICVFGLLHHPISPLSSQVHQIKTSLYKGVEGNEGLSKKLTGQDRYIQEGISNRFRMSGPFPSPIPFAYFLLSALFLNLYMYLRSNKKIYLFNLSIILLCSFMSQTRSLILAEVVMIMIFWVFINNKRINTYKVGIVITVLALAVLYVNRPSSSVQTGESSRMTKFNDRRELLWITGMYAIAKHPFGISKEQYAEVRREMYYITGSLTVLYMPSHNGFINTAFNYTVIGYFLMIGFCIFIYKRTKPLSKNYRIIFNTFYIAYIINATFHNNFLFYSDYTVYMVLMLITIHYQYEKNKGLEYPKQLLNEA